MIFVIILVTALAYFIVNALPGNILYTILGTSYTPHAAAELSRELHLNRPIFVRYFEWLWGAVRGNFGTSLINHENVSSALLASAPATIELLIFAQVLAIALAVIFATLSVLSPFAAVDRIFTGVSLLGNSVPAFVTALICLTIFSDHLHLVSAFGWVSPSQGGWGANVSALFMPSMILAFSVFPGYMRVLRQEMNDQLDNEEYVILARMKGISSKRLIIAHVARNSALGIITLIGVSTGFLVGGAVIIEQIFSIPGIGSLIYNAITQSDVTMVEGCILAITVSIVLLNLLADIAQAALDPRVRDSA